ncbi:ATP-binding protein [Kineococcus sp. NUM-3379]
MTGDAAAYDGPRPPLAGRVRGPLPLRWRMALLQGGTFLVAGTVIVTILALLVRASLEQRSAIVVATVDGEATPGVAARPAVPTPSTTRVTIPLAESVARLQEAILQDLVRSSVLVVLLGTLTAVVVGRVLAGRALAPVSRMTATARRVAHSGVLSERIALEGPHDELKELADTFDAMLERLDRSFDGQRMFVANASHELRTPLATTQTVLEVAMGDPDASADLRAVGPVLLQSVRRSEQLIDGLLLLARGEREPARREATDVADLARAAVAQVGGEARARDLTVSATTAPAVVRGDPVLLERLVLNLLHNAVRHNHDGGDVEVEVGVVDGAAALTVANTGPVVPEDDVERLFEPFRRGAQRLAHPGDRGAGLGLSIVRMIASAHGGTVRAHPRPGGGLLVRVSLPRT